MFSWQSQTPKQRRMGKEGTVLTEHLCKASEIPRNQGPYFSLSSKLQHVLKTKNPPKRRQNVKHPPDTLPLQDVALFHTLLLAIEKPAGEAVEGSWAPAAHV